MNYLLAARDLYGRWLVEFLDSPLRGFVTMVLAAIVLVMWQLLAWAHDAS